jgi:hypothetical protein
MTNLLTYNYYFMKQNDQLKQPFFARFLESQSAAKSQPGQQGLWPPFTLKFADDFEQTHRYPSDNDDFPSS